MQINFVEYFENFLQQGLKDKIAIFDQDQQVSFFQLETNAKKVAHHIIKIKNCLNQPVAVFLPKSAETVFADLGIVYSGNFYSNLDCKSPIQRLKNILGNIQPSLVLTDRAHETQLHAMGVPTESILLVEDALAGRGPISTAVLLSRLDRVIDTDPLCIINTSGSTGTPKGVVLSHRGTIDFMDWVFSTLGLDGSERIGSLSPYYFDIYTLELTTCLAKGATMVLIPDQMSLFPARLMPYLAEQEVTFLFWVPSIMVAISNQGLLEQFPLPTLRKVFFAGEVFPTKHLNAWRRVLPQVTFVNLYGPIEIHVDCTYFIVDREFSDDEPLPIGFPCRNTDVLILNSENRPCTVGEQGELCIRGSSLAMGYWNDPEKTAKAFVQNPLNSKYNELIYRTGDIVYLNPRGEIMIVGRKDFQIKHMGYRIELPEIEHQALCVQGIVNACVLYNADRKEITLFYESGGQEVTIAHIRKAMGEVLPKYMLPTVVQHMDELPRNPNGKIDRNGLKGMLKGLS